jgi:hypothetical protein
MTGKGTFLIRLRRAIAARVDDTEGERGVAMLSALLFMVIVLGLSVVLASSVLSQSAPTKLAQKNTRTVYAAQAGLQTALGIIRSIPAAPDYTGAVYGTPSKLPCTLTGNADGAADGVTYQVTVSYYTADPTGLTGTALSSILLACPLSGSVGPKFALITSKGAGDATLGVTNIAAGNRTLSALYTFQVSTINVAGGRIYDGGNAYCLDAVTPTAGSLITFLPVSQCTNDADELWIYDVDYELKLASTTVGGLPGLCITGPVVANGATQNALLQPCLGVTDPNRWNQLWSWMGSYTWQGQNQTISTGYSNNYLSPGYATGTDISGKPLLVSNGVGSGTFTPSALVGAGAASYNTHQIVNYKEFGRCADVTGEQIGASAMISYPCKQDPTGTGVNLKWNHHWYYQEPPSFGPPADTTKANTITTTIYVNLSNVNSPQYCLQTPTSGSAPFFPVFQLCNGSAAQQWKRTYDTGTYSTSYWIQDNQGRCLQADSSQLYNSSYSELDVASCNGSDAQKWNAPPAVVSADVGGYKELG